MVFQDKLSSCTYILPKKKITCLSHIIWKQQRRYKSWNIFMHLICHSIRQINELYSMYDSIALYIATSLKWHSWKWSCGNYNWKLDNNLWLYLTRKKLFEENRDFATLIKYSYNLHWSGSSYWHLIFFFLQFLFLFNI